MNILKVSHKNFKQALEKAVDLITSGKVIVCPTDTVYGLVCDAQNKKAVERIFKIKNRPKAKPIGVFARDIKMAEQIAVISKDKKKTIEELLLGKTTIVLKSKKFFSGIVVKNKIGFRIPNYKLLNNLLEKLNKPLAQTSANISGKAAETKIKQVLKYFQGKKNQPNLVLDAGDLPLALPSAVIDLTLKKAKVLRRGD